MHRDPAGPDRGLCRGLIDLLLPLHATEAPPAAYRPAAVLVLLCPVADVITVVLIRKTVGTGVHAGQMAFPGGAREPSDVTLLDTALRETWEEIGITPGLIRPLGCLEPILVGASRFHVTPFVGWLEQRPEVVLNPDEVDAVMYLPLETLFGARAIDEEILELRTGRCRVQCYRYDGNVIWGATARILGHLARAIDAHAVVIADIAAINDGSGPP